MRRYQTNFFFFFYKNSSCYIKRIQISNFFFSLDPYGIVFIYYFVYFIGKSFIFFKSFFKIILNHFAAVYGFLREEHLPQFLTKCRQYNIIN